MPPTAAATPPPAEPIDLDRARKLFFAAADPLRLAILAALRSGPKDGPALHKLVDTPISVLSQPLNLLAKAGLAAATTEGRVKTYALTEAGRDLLNLAARAA